jgi:hypothetical protein
MVIAEDTAAVSGGHITAEHTAGYLRLTMVVKVDARAFTAKALYDKQDYGRIVRIEENPAAKVGIIVGNSTINKRVSIGLLSTPI